MIFTAALVALAATGASAQMSQAAGKLSYPPSRGSDPLTSRIGPCQGYEVGGRIQYPLSGGRVSWDSIRDLGDVQIAYSTNINPTAQGDFTAVGQNLTNSWVGSQCVQGPDFGSLGLSAGDQVVLQFAYRTGPGNWPMFECADLTLTSNTDFADLNMTIPCENRVLSTQMRSSANPQLTKLREEAAAKEAAEAEAAASSSSSSNLTVTQAGIVGAFTTLGVCIIAILAAQVAGVAAFGKKARAAKRSHHANQNEKEVASLNSA